MKKNWTVWWQGSGPMKGSHIMQLTPSGLGYDGSIAYLGEDSHALACEIVENWNQSP